MQQCKEIRKGKDPKKKTCNDEVTKSNSPLTEAKKMAKE